MSKRLTIPQLLAMEKLTGRQYYLNGLPRTKPRTPKEADNIGIPLDHLIGLPWKGFFYKVMRPAEYGMCPSDYPAIKEKTNKMLDRVLKKS
jgi:hypothetical protein